MAQFVTIDVSGAPATHFGTVRLLDALFSGLLWGIFTSPLVGPFVLPLIDADVSIPVLNLNPVWLLFSAPPLVFAFRFAAVYFSPGRKLSKADLPAYGRSLAEIRSRLAPLKRTSRNYRGGWAALNIFAAIATLFLAHSVLDVFDGASCRRAICAGEFCVGMFNGEEYSVPFDPYNRPVDPCENPPLFVEQNIAQTFFTLLALAFVLNAFRLWRVKAGFRSAVSSYLLIALVWIVVVYGWFFALKWTQDNYGAWSGWFIFSVYPVFILVRSLTSRVASIAEPSAAHILKRDQRAPVLFIRSFEDDRRTLWGGDSGPRFETVLADALRPYGPFVGIAQPGELRRAGAAREYYSGDAWQSAVLGLMDQSAIIVAVAGLTPGLDWELARLAEGERLNKAIFVFVPDPQSRGSRFQRMREILADAREGSQLVDVDINGALVAHFSRNHGWIVITGKAGTKGEYQMALDLAVYGMLLA